MKRLTTKNAESTKVNCASVTVKRNGKACYDIRWTARVDGDGMESKSYSSARQAFDCLRQRFGKRFRCQVSGELIWISGGWYFGFLTWALRPDRLVEEIVPYNFHVLRKPGTPFEFKISQGASPGPVSGDVGARIVGRAPASGRNA